MNEQQNIEFKSKWADNILKTVCAFANTNGGTIYRAYILLPFAHKTAKNFSKTPIFTLCSNEIITNT